MEAIVRCRRGKEEKSIRQGILDLMSSNYNIKMSSYHGGEIEGPSVRKVMYLGPEVFTSIYQYFQSSNLSTDLPATENEIITTCNNIGTIYGLLDGSIAILNTKRGKVTDETILQLEERCTVLLREYNRLGLSITPKFHVLINHTTT